MEFVGGDGKQIEGLGGEGFFSEGLNGVAVEKDAAGSTEFADFGDGVEGAGFVVGGHEGDQNGVGPESRFESFQIYGALGRNGEFCDRKSLVFLEPIEGVENGVVFGGGGDEVMALA
jgi:hypothetical protein